MAKRTAPRIPSTPNTPSTPKVPQIRTDQSQNTHVVDLETYGCFACGDELHLTAGIITCEFHFMCNECAAYAFLLASADMSAFPVSCCSSVCFKQVEDLLSPEVADSYKQKEYEHYTTRVLRVYCANEDCRRCKRAPSLRIRIRHTLTCYVNP